MAFDVDYVNSILSNTETSLEDKVTQLMAEHEASERGLIQKRDQLLGNEKKLKANIEDYTNQIAERDSKLADLESKLAQSSTDKESSREYWETKFSADMKKKDGEIAEWAEKFNGLQRNYYKKLKNEAMNDAVKDLQFVEGLQGGFMATVMLNNEFEAKDIDGEIIFLNKDNKTIKDVMHEFALTPEGKSYIRNPSSGGGAYSSGTSSARKSVGDGTLTREQYNELARNPAKFAEFRATHKDWKIVD